MISLLLERLNFKLTILKKCSKLSYYHNPGKAPLLAMTLGKLLEKTVQKYPDTAAIISLHQNKTITFSKLLQVVDKLAAALLKFGLIKGDRVGILAPNLIEWEITMLACSRIGAILVQLNPSYQAAEIEYCINKVQMKLLISDHKMKNQNFYEILNQIADITKSDKNDIKSSKIPSLKSILMISDEFLSGTYNFNEVINEVTANEYSKIEQYQNKIDMDDGLNIQFTSGTTGLPKATLLSHFSVVNNSHLLATGLGYYKNNYKICLHVPMFHTFGATVGVLGGLHYGSTLVLPSSTYSPEKSLEAIASEKCDVVYGTPTMYIDLVNHQRKRNLDISLEIACTGAAPTSPKLIDDMIDILRIKNVINLLGMTESTAVVFQSNLTDSTEQVNNTVGCVQEHTEVKVVDDNYEIVPFGAPGELCVRSYSTMRCYFNDEEKTKATLGSDGWLKSGDKFILYENGYGQIVGRIKDMINRGGENIFPKEIEDFISKHPDVLECHIVGLPHERLGEEVCGCLRIKTNRAICLKDVQNFCRGNMANFKIPTKLHIVENFPKTASGKIMKYKLIEMLKQKNKENLL